MKSILRSGVIQAYEAEQEATEPAERENKPPKESDWELFYFGLEVIALIGVVYIVHLFIHNYL